MHTINNNRLIDNYGTGLIEELKKGGESTERRNVALSPILACNTYIPILNPETISQTIKKPNYASTIALKPSQVPENP